MVKEMKYVLEYILLWLVAFYAPCKAQVSLDLLNRTITPQNKDVVGSNAPDDITRTMRQDSKGNIWIAAFDWVHRYDGTIITNFKR